MFKFLIKGLIRDKKRILIPIIVIIIAVCVLIITRSLNAGFTKGIVDLYARYEYGHLKIVTQEFNNNESNKDMEMSIIGTNNLLNILKKNYPNIDWQPRIFFGGIIDIYQNEDDIKVNGPIIGSAYNLLNKQHNEKQRLKFSKNISKGRNIENNNETIISDIFAKKYNIKIGDTLSILTATMYGSTTSLNFKIVGFINFGMPILDKGAMIIDITDAQKLLDMEDATTLILGFFPNNKFNLKKAQQIEDDFNNKYLDKKDKYSPIMIQLLNNNIIYSLVKFTKKITFQVLVILILALFVILWNVGVISNIKRYNEFGIRLALGEEKSHIYITILIESLLIGIIGSIIGTMLGILIAYYFSIHGIPIGDTQKSSIYIENVIKTSITTSLYYIGFIPGIIAIFLGTAISGRVIFKRNISNLFKEIE